jgi:hypothetical protein
VLFVPQTSSASCDQAIFVDQASDVSVFPDAVQVEVGGFWQRFQRRGAVQGAVWPVLIVVGFVVAQYPQQVGLVPDEGAVQELAAASPDPAFRVCTFWATDAPFPRWPHHQPSSAGTHKRGCFHAL